LDTVKRGRGRPRLEDTPEEIRAEVGEKQIDALISRRASSSSTHGYEAKHEIAIRVYHQRAREQRRIEWFEFHMSLSTLHARLSEEHERKAQQLLGVPRAPWIPSACSTRT
jgi:hypothetical protein